MFLWRVSTHRAPYLYHQADHALPPPHQSSCLQLGTVKAYVTQFLAPGRDDPHVWPHWYVSCGVTYTPSPSRSFFLYLRLALLPFFHPGLVWLFSVYRPVFLWCIRGVCYPSFLYALVQHNIISMDCLSCTLQPPLPPPTQEVQSNRVGKHGSQWKF